MEYTLDEVQTHNTRESLWLIIDNDVYDVSTFVDEHPGGSKPFLKYAGTDITAKFASINAHKSSKDLPNFLATLKIGSLKQ
jgi:cytochrome b involved in lipid metabolism